MKAILNRPIFTGSAWIVGLLLFLLLDGPTLLKRWVLTRIGASC